jgi:hypothetical protein
VMTAGRSRRRSRPGRPPPSSPRRCSGPCRRGLCSPAGSWGRCRYCAGSCRGSHDVRVGRRAAAAGEEGEAEGGSERQGA